MNINAIISQRLKLAQENLEFADWDTALEYVISQDRIMTPEEIQAEKNYIHDLYLHSRDTVNAMQDNAQDYFLSKIHALDLSTAEMTEWIVQTAQPLLSLNSSGSVGPEGFIPAPVEHELQQLAEERKATHETVIPTERLEALMAYCLMAHTMIALNKPATETHGEEAEDSYAETAEDTLSMKAVASLRDAGKLPERWQDLSAEEIHAMFSFVRRDDTIHMANDALIRKLTEQMVRDYADIRSDAATPAVEISEADLEGRHLLAVAALLNMRATGKLPEDMRRMSNEDLAVLAYTGTEMNFYFDEAAAGHISLDIFWDIVGRLLIAGFFAFMSVLLFSTPSTFIEKALGVFTIMSSILYVCEAVEIFMDNLFPAGIDETRLGIRVKATVAQIRIFAAKVKNRVLANIADKNEAEPVHETDTPAPSTEKQEDEEEDEDECENPEKEFED